tara:strand:+ start:494 stop:610 length:117 start_codon:yes stop_codon:yes gene_type:complete
MVWGEWYLKGKKAPYEEELSIFLSVFKDKCPILDGLLG